MSRAAAAVALLLAALALAPSAHAQSRHCQVPLDGEWARVGPEEAGMDPAKLQAAVDYGSQNLSFAVRVFRRGCLVKSDRFEALNDSTRFESWSLGKSVTSILFGAAMTDGLISADDPLGSLLPEADAAHGKITLRDLLTMSSGLKWNGFRDYNIFTMPDRVRDALTLEAVREPGTYYEYHQSPVALVAKAVERATGEDARQFMQREVLDQLGIEGQSWDWERDPSGNIEGFWGTRMKPNDFGRLGELMRREGRWRGERILSRAYIRNALEASATNGCYGWLIWLNVKSPTPCVSPRIGDQPVTRDSGYPGMPRDMYTFSGLFGQLVVVFPSQEIVLVRTGFDPGLVNFAGDSGWQHGLFSRVLGAVTDQKVTFSKRFEGEDLPNEDGGFQDALLEPDQYSKGLFPSPLPPAGPARARAATVVRNHVRVTKRGRVPITVRCPPRWPAAAPDRCRGVARLEGARAPKRYSIAAGKAEKVRFSLRPRKLVRERLSSARRARLTLRNRDATGGTRSVSSITLR